MPCFSLILSGSGIENKMAVMVHMSGTHVLVRFPGHLEGKLGWDTIDENSIPPAIFSSEAKAREGLAKMEQDAKRMGEYHPLMEKLEFIPASVEESGLVPLVLRGLEDISELLEAAA